MDDISEKLQSMLSDEEGLKKLQSIYEILSESGTHEACSEEEKKDETKDSESEESDSEFDFSSFFKLQSLLEGVNTENSSTALITALKPYLSEERRKKADKAVKILNLLNIYTTLRETGLLNDIL